MGREYGNLEVVVADHDGGQSTPPESVVIAIGKDHQPGKPAFWNRSAFRHIRVTNKRNKAAVVSIQLSGLNFRDKGGGAGYVNVRYTAWCEPKREELLAIGIAKHTREGRIFEDVNERIEDWLRTEVQGKESSFLSSLLAGDTCAVYAQRVQNLAATHLGLSIELAFEVADREKLQTVSLDPVTMEVFPSGFARTKVPVTVRADIRPVPGRDLIALASVAKAPGFKDWVREEARRVIETSITLDELNARQPTRAKDMISEAIDRRLHSEGWQLLNLDLITNWKTTPRDLKISAPFTFQLSGLAREWTGQISFLAHPGNQALFFESGHTIESAPGWAHTNAIAIATRTMSGQTFETVLDGYDKTKLAIRTAVESLLRANGYSISGFNVTTMLPMEGLSGVIRTPERQGVEFATRFMNRKVRMTYFVEYQFPDLARVKRAVMMNEDVPQSVAAAVDQVLRDQLRSTELLDFYFHFDSAEEKGAISVCDVLVGAIRKRLKDDFGADVRSYQLVREDDDVLSKIDEMVQPARQGVVAPFDIPHPRLDAPVQIRTLVFLVGSFSKEHFYQFVVTKPRIEQLQDSVKTHCEQWLADVSPEIFMRTSNRELRSIFERFVVLKIQQEFGVTVSILNFILGRHEDVLPPPGTGSGIAKDLRMWQNLLEKLRSQYEGYVLTGDDDAVSTNEKMEQARKEIKRLSGELEKLELDDRIKVRETGLKQLMAGSGQASRDENGEAAAGGSTN